jgi:hypothetical protein
MRPAPGKEYLWVKTVHMAKQVIEQVEEDFNIHHCRGAVIELIDIDHDAGDFVCAGGDYIKLLDWLEETGRDYPIRIHSQNVVGVANMRAIIERNGWKEIR